MPVCSRRKVRTRCSRSQSRRTALTTKKADHQCCIQKETSPWLRTRNISVLRSSRWPRSSSPWSQRRGYACLARAGVCVRAYVCGCSVRAYVRGCMCAGVCVRVYMHAGVFSSHVRADEWRTTLRADGRLPASHMHLLELVQEALVASRLVCM